MLRGKDLLPCLGIEDGFIIFKVMSLHVKRNNGGKLEIKCVLLTMKTIISQEKFKKKEKRQEWSTSIWGWKERSALLRDHFLNEKKLLFVSAHW